MGITDIVAETAQVLRSVTNWVKDAEIFTAEKTPRTDAQEATPYDPDETPGKFVTVEGINLHYLEQGSRTAPPIVYIHGANAYAEELFSGPLGALLARNYRVIAFDRPGFGRSERAPGMAGPSRQARLIRTAVTALGIEKPILMGHSWGGALTLAYSVAYGSELSGVVNMSGWCSPSNQALVSFLAFSLGPYINAVRALAPPDYTRQMGERIFTHVFSPDPVPAAFARFSPEIVMRKSQISANGEDLKALNNDMMLLETHYPAISVPTEILIATQDHIVDPESHGLSLSRKMPTARVTRIIGHGHMAHHLDPRPFVDAVDRLAGRL